MVVQVQHRSEEPINFVFEDNKTALDFVRFEKDRYAEHLTGNRTIFYYGDGFTLSDHSGVILTYKIK